MKVQILFYTFGGATKKEAYRLADELRAKGNEVVCSEVKEVKERSLMSTFFSGCPKAMLRKKSKIVAVDIAADADRYIIGCPIWAGYPAPAYNSIIALIPEGKEPDLFFCSGGGEEPKSKQGTIDDVKARRLTFISYRDIKTGAPPAKETSDGTAAK